jgi:hypothetical protein
LLVTRVTRHSSLASCSPSGTPPPLRRDNPLAAVPRHQYLGYQPKMRQWRQMRQMRHFIFGLFFSRLESTKCASPLNFPKSVAKCHTLPAVLCAVRVLSGHHSGVAPRRRRDFPEVPFYTKTALGPRVEALDKFESALWIA